MTGSYLEMIRSAGVVGAGGAGFPTHIKVDNKAEIVIANGVECEPLLRVDRQLMELYAEKVLEGMRIVMDISNAKRGVVCIKEKYDLAFERLNEVIGRSSGKSSGKSTGSVLGNVSVHKVGNYYPAGDEQQIVYEVTGKVVPLAGLPLDVGAIVVNVNTLFNIACAVENIPVTNRIVTVTGDVEKPVTLNVPIGTPVRKLIENAKGSPDESKYSLILGGPAMGYVENDWSAPVTKTLGGVIVLPNDHYLIKKKTMSLEKVAKLSKSVCCQCSFCTELCPRNALGLAVEPHKVMRAIGYEDPATLGNEYAAFGCCDCGVCTYYACNMGLNPAKMVTAVKGGLAKRGVRPEKIVPAGRSDFREQRKIPVKRFVERLGVGKYDKDAPLDNVTIAVNEVKILLKQHIGVPSVAIVKEGDVVKRGDLIGYVEEGKVGANVHASIDGRVIEVNAAYIVIKANSM